MSSAQRTWRNQAHTQQAERRRSGRAHRKAVRTGGHLTMSGAVCTSEARVRYDDGTSECYVCGRTSWDAIK